MRKASTHSYSAGQIFKAWSPFLILMVVMAIWGTPTYKSFVNKSLKWFVLFPALAGTGRGGAQVRPDRRQAHRLRRQLPLGFLHRGRHGHAALLPALHGGAAHLPRHRRQVLVKTFKQLQFTLITLASVLGIGFLANYSGMSFTLGLAFAAYTGMAFPIFSPVIGMVGVFLTGSVTSSAALFGKLQQVTAMSLGMNPSSPPPPTCSAPTSAS